MACTIESVYRGNIKSELYKILVNIKKNNLIEFSDSETFVYLLDNRFCIYSFLSHNEEGTKNTNPEYNELVFKDVQKFSAPCYCYLIKEITEKKYYQLFNSVYKKFYKNLKRGII